MKHGPKTLCNKSFHNVFNLKRYCIFRTNFHAFSAAKTITFLDNTAFILCRMQLHRAGPRALTAGNTFFRNSNWRRMVPQAGNQSCRTSHRTERAPGSFIPDKAENNSYKCSNNYHAVKYKTNSRKVSPVFPDSQSKHSHHKGKNCQTERKALKKTRHFPFCSDFSHQTVKKVPAGTEIPAPETARKKGNDNRTDHTENCRQRKSKIKKTGDNHCQ